MFSYMYSPGRAEGRSPIVLIGLFVALLAIANTGHVSDAGLTSAKAPSPMVPHAALASVEAVLGRVPLSFIRNAGQTDPAVRFHIKDAGASIFFAAGEVVFSLRTESMGIETRRSIRMSFDGASPGVQVEGLSPQPGVVNFLKGNDPQKWQTGVATYSAIEYRDLYPGIDLVFDGARGYLKSEFLLAPGVDPGGIHLVYDGFDSLGLREDGAIVVRFGADELVDSRPVIYQEINGRVVEVEGGYRLLGSGRVGFTVGAYDPDSPLVIDPSIAYSSYLGGSGFDAGRAIAVDDQGQAYITGTTDSADFPTASAFQGSFGGSVAGPPFVGDAFVSKVNAAGSALVYSTYLGGSDNDFGRSITADSNGNAYVTGETNSANFPTSSPLQAAYGGGADAFVTKLSADGSQLLYSTFLGGTSFDEGFGIAVASDGSVYVSGDTASDDFPTANALQPGLLGFLDAWVAKINAAGSALVYSTYLGGTGMEGGLSVAVDGEGNAYVGGNTTSTDFPVANAFQSTFGGAGPVFFADGFVTKLNAAGSALTYSTYFGGSSDEWILGIAVNAAGEAFVTGFTVSTNLPTLDPIQGALGGGFDAFVAGLNAAGNGLLYSTYIGGSRSEAGVGIGLDSEGNAYIAGGTNSTDFPVADPLQATFSGGSGKLSALGGLLWGVLFPGGVDGFITAVDSTGERLLFSTYYGATGDDAILGIGVDSTGDVYVSGITDSLDFPTASFQDTYGGGTFDAFVAKLDLADVRQKLRFWIADRIYGPAPRIVLRTR